MCTCWRQSGRFLALGELDWGKCDAGKQMVRYCHTRPPLSTQSWSGGQAKRVAGFAFQKHFKALVEFVLNWCPLFLPQIHFCLYRVERKAQLAAFKYQKLQIYSQSQSLATHQPIAVIMLRLSGCFSAIKICLYYEMRALVWKRSLF